MLCDILPGLRGQLFQDEPEHGGRPHADELLALLVLPGTLLSVSVSVSVCVREGAGQALQAAARTVGGLLRCGQGAVDDLELVGEGPGGQQDTGLGQQDTGLGQQYRPRETQTARVTRREGTPVRTRETASAGY
ncbi:hypothetical protein [Streptomyces altiplanensis]